MANPVIMPRQGQSVESCIISTWNKKEGDEIRKGDFLFSYETDKAAFECEADSEGILLKILYREGDEVPVLRTVAWIGEAGEQIGESEESTGEVPQEQKPESQAVEVTVAEVPEPAAKIRSSGEKIKISPRARKTAGSLGIGAEGIAGSGAGGRIMERDILKAAENRKPATPLARAVAAETGKSFPGTGTGPGNRVTSADLLSDSGLTASDFEVKKISNMRRIIAARMHESLQNSAQLTHHTSADARRLTELRKMAKEAYEKGQSENITINDMVCYAVIRALKKHPMANSHFLGDSMRVFNKVHLGLAVDTERGLMVPTIRNADDLNIQGLASRLKEVANACKKGNIDPELLDSQSASFSVSNLGAYGVELFTPVINLPQVAILGVNTIIHRPADLGNGVFGFIPFIGLSLTYDHRALDGAPASALLREIRLEIENLDFTL